MTGYSNEICVPTTDFILNVFYLLYFQIQYAFHELPANVHTVNNFSHIISHR